MDVNALKEAIKCCAVNNCFGCPRNKDIGCVSDTMRDADSYIAELEERLSIMQESMEALEKRCNALEALEQRCKALEKRNEPVKVRHLHNVKVTMHEGVTFTDECGNCGGYLMKSWKACPLCGLAVKWDE